VCVGYGEEEGLVGEWAQEKLQYLQAYLPSFTTAAKKALQCYYIDGFAGQGDWIGRRSGERIVGSPLIAVSTEPPFTKCYFIERDPRRCRALEQRLREYPRDRYEIIQGKLHQVIGSVLEQIDPRAPTFVFLDPSGLSVRWSTIELLARWKTELFINFPFHHAIQRLMPKNPARFRASHITLLNEVFGSTEWQELYRQSLGRRYRPGEFIELYKRRLRELGYVFTIHSKTIKTETGLPLYYLIWVGKHPVGRKIISHVLHQQFDPQRHLPLEPD